jgi:hypothetical protein
MNHYLIQLIVEFNNLVALYYATYAKGDHLKKRYFVTGDDAAYLETVYARDAYQALIDAAIEPLAEAIASHIDETGEYNVSLDDYNNEVFALVEIKLAARRYAAEVEIERYKEFGAINYTPEPWNPWAAAGLD